MANAKGGRKKDIAVIVIVALFLISSIAGTFLLAIQGSGNTKTAAEIEQERMIEEYQKKQEEIVREPLEGYEAESFDKEKVTKLEVETLKEGGGKAATADSTVSANYFGWTSDGKIFDSTNRGGQAQPIDFPLSGVIEGWSKGLVGVKQGSTVKLTIPGDMAYGNQDNGMGTPIGPLRFIVELVEVK